MWSTQACSARQSERRPSQKGWSSMDDRDRQRLGNLIGHAQAAIGYARAHGRGWWRSAETIDAVLMRISQVGEAASKISPEVLAEAPGVTWRDIKGGRATIV